MERPFGNGSGGWSENNQRLTRRMGPCRQQCNGGEGGDGHAALAVTPWTQIGRNVFRKTETACDEIHKLQYPSFHKQCVRRGVATRCGDGARAHREREFSSAEVGTMGFAFSFPTYCIEGRLTSTSRPRCKCPQRSFPEVFEP